MFFSFRPMSFNDFDAIMEIQSLCFAGDFPEDRSSLLAKFRASPETCFVMNNENGQVCAYLFAIPWMARHAPSLNAPSCVLPENPDCLYLHDLSVHPKCRGNRLAEQLIQTAFAAATRAGLKQCCLISVQDSMKFWSRHGFSLRQISANDEAKLSSYGEDARFMAVVFS